jgi:hypothetical protein
VSTVNKDFKVKNGLIVGLGASFGGVVSVATPTLANHAVTKEYVDNLTGAPSIPVSDNAPASPTNGDLWFDSVTERVHVYYSGEWLAIATLADSEVLQDHIHDTAIDGTGLIVSTFVSGGSYDEPGVLVSAGSYNTNSWENTWDGGTPIDNFN